MKHDIILKSINELIPYVNNPKQHPADQVDKIASSIKNYGFTVPMVIDGQNEIIMGHGRLLAAKKLGMEEVPCVVRDDLTESQVKALRIADNRVSESEWDIEILLAEIDGLEEFTGFDLAETEAMANWESEVLDLGAVDLEGDHKEDAQRLIFVFEEDDDILFVREILNLKDDAVVVDGVDLVSYMRGERGE